MSTQVPAHARSRPVQETTRVTWSGAGAITSKPDKWRRGEASSRQVTDKVKNCFLREKKCSGLHGRATHGRPSRLPTHTQDMLNYLTNAQVVKGKHRGELC